MKERLRLDLAVEAANNDSHWVFRGVKDEVAPDVVTEDWHAMTAAERMAFMPAPPGPAPGYLGEIE